MESLALQAVTPGAARRALMKPSSKALDGAVSAYLCNFLDENDVKPLKVLKAAGLTPKTAADWHTPDAVNTLYTVAQRHMPQELDTDSEEADDSDMQSEVFDSAAD
jgi:hypothetical protein